MFDNLFGAKGAQAHLTTASGGALLAAVPEHVPFNRPTRGSCPTTMQRTMATNDAGEVSAATRGASGVTHSPRRPRVTRPLAVQPPPPSLKSGYTSEVGHAVFDKLFAGDSSRHTGPWMQARGGSRRIRAGAAGGYQRPGTRSGKQAVLQRVSMPAGFRAALEVRPSRPDAAAPPQTAAEDGSNAPRSAAPATACTGRPSHQTSSTSADRFWDDYEQFAHNLLQQISADATCGTSHAGPTPRGVSALADVGEESVFDCITQQAGHGSTGCRASHRLPSAARLHSSSSYGGMRRQSSDV